MITKSSKSKPKSLKKRTKNRKQKFLSLKHHLTAKKPKPPMQTTNDHKEQLINLFPLHPENLMEQDKLDMSCIFSSCDDATTLTGILCSDDDDDDEDSNIPSPSSVNYADEEFKLVRTAMKRKNYKINDHEKWVCYSEVVERKNNVIRGMSSSSSSTTSCYHHHHHHHHHHHNLDDHDNKRSKLVLKLDYEKIMNSWVNKGPPYIPNNLDPDTPQTVPELIKDDFFLPSSINGSAHDERGNGGSWMVPELAHTENTGPCEGDDGLQAMGSSAMTQNRLASVQRYKEKRRNRLFAKTIRYEVRKLNAEKRPRIKGRFVKRN
ncbi:uncharacterized protein [Rutidosis leptorrhynchoides]|uniref:uncharacterized protein n=1 Tax=Rutidosis leptorrhynchoides TaxID=125765 RepID=UPI003A9987D0